MGIFNSTSWRTLLVGIAMGYVMAWGMHWATTLYAQGVPVHHKILMFTPWAH